MDLDDLVKSSSEYMKKEDVSEEGVNLTIKEFRKVVVKTDDGEEQKIALYFVEEGYKPLVLNITNKNRLKAATGETTTEGVKGKTICVFNDPFVEFGGKTVGGVRIKKATAPAHVVGSGPNKGETLHDDVPF